MELKKEYILRLKSTIRKWDNTHPVDYWWREKFNIPFGSKQHLEMDFISQQMWYEEEEYIAEIKEKLKAKEKAGQENYNVRVKEGAEDTSIKLTEAQVDEAFDDLNLEQYQANIDAQKDEQKLDKSQRKETLQTLIDEAKGQSNGRDD